MSWTLAVPPTPKDAFAAAVDAATASGQDQSLPGMAEDVATAKAALKAMGQQVKRSLVSGSAYGHCLQPDEGPLWADSLSVAVNGSDPA